MSLRSELDRPAPKVPGSFDRCVPLEETLALLPRLRAQYGITRIADITHLDRIGIPVMSAIVPESPDTISVYNGKGVTMESALAGAVMEAVERQIAAAPALPVTMLDAHDVLASLAPGHRHVPSPGQQTIATVMGDDVIGGGTIAVPLALVQSPWHGEPVLYHPSSNGLAAGNTLAEAVYHALCERIERHLLHVAHSAGYHRPRELVAAFAGRPISLPNFIDDPVAVQIQLPTGLPVVDDLVARIHNAGLTLALRAVADEMLPALMIATIVDPHAGLAAAHAGFGCSLSPVHGAIRAITEAAQSRAADFMGAREDLYVHDAAAVPRGGHRRSAQPPYGRWYFDAPAPARTLESFPDRSSADVTADVRTLVAALRQTGIEHVVIVDLAPPQLPLHVVRTIIPALEGDDRILVQAEQATADPEEPA